MIDVSRISWKPSWRIIPSRFPPIQLFERVTDPADLEAVMELEGMTNPRLRDEVGDIQLVPPEERVSGPGSTIIMAAFTHLNPNGSRFTDGSYGVYYAAKELETAIAETKYHREEFMRATNEPRMELDMRVYLVDVDADYHDIRGQNLSCRLSITPQIMRAVSSWHRIYARQGFMALPIVAFVMAAANALPRFARWVCPMCVKSGTFVISGTARRSRQSMKNESSRQTNLHVAQIQFWHMGADL